MTTREGINMVLAALERHEITDDELCSVAVDTLGPRVRVKGAALQRLGFPVGRVSTSSQYIHLHASAGGVDFSAMLPMTTANVLAYLVTEEVGE